MLALKSKLTLTLIMATTLMCMSDTTVGQQTPSQRYQPVRATALQAGPPSVHVPSQNTQMLRSQNRTEKPDFTGTRYTFSDQNMSGTNGLRDERGTIQQTSFQADVRGETDVPAILAGAPPTRQQPIAKYQPPAKPSFAPHVDEEPPRTPSDFAPAMNHVQGKIPQIGSEQFAGQKDDISAQMAALKQQLEEKNKAELMAAEALAAEKLAAEKLAAEALAAESAKQAEIDRIAQERRVAAEIAAQRVAEENAAANQVSNSELASEDNDAVPKLVAKQANMAPAVIQLTNDNYDSEPVVDTNVRPASSEENATPEKPSITLGAPALEVETFGPGTVGVDKPANYQIVVHNRSSNQADRILVGINMPQWIDVENVNMTTGNKEITDGQDQARLVWSIDKIPGNSSQTITVTAVPRKAEMFDVGVEWTLVPRVGKTNIRVTEPKLEMSIAGPPEVLYGETALYHVTVRNPGTGEAENVIVKLPEALSGESATLGNIQAGKEKYFQVELLARTAGSLNLIATAAANGNLQTSAERELTVRRADLQISLEGPSLKYSGSVARYQVTITNPGDAIANEVVAAIALPTGVKYLGGIEGATLNEGVMRWPVGNLEPSQTRTYKLNCQLDTSGDLQMEVGARGKGDLAATSACLTTVETVADLVLTVADPKGPLPTGEEVSYEIKVQNRGSKSAKGVDLVMQFSEGIEPRMASGLEHKIVPGQVLFSPIGQIDPGQEMTFKIAAEAIKSGTHIFRAQLTCQDSDAREIAEGTTRFFGDAVQAAETANSNDAQSSFGSNDFQR